MLEFTNILIKVIDGSTPDRKFKYIPVNSEIEKMSLLEIIRTCGLDRANIDLVYNDNSKSRVTASPIDHVDPVYVKNEIICKNIRMYVITKLLDTIKYMKMFSEVDIITESRKKELRKMLNNAEYSLYLIYGEEEKNRICKKITRDTSKADLFNIVKEAEEKNNVESHHSSPSL